MQVEVRHDEAASRFEATVEGLLCRADYRLDGDTMRVFHTEVPPALEGRGIAAELVRALFAHAADRGLKVDPLCSYVRAWARRHPEVQGLLARGS
ncbi:N-acetyltransferase [Burkholderiaceae bacterium FT117]|uniref:GNAT family N-acetyltransferase n=1 Tax=Zeimonas sediminis TaxID=2944268 RepID=UPI0023431801|nr:GNAT family N-acetyltransferase [Zeimonas sediminis]MCM5569132.1 N-acetyltransferase [Zeimonas sediminis]